MVQTSHRYHRSLSPPRFLVLVLALVVASARYAGANTEKAIFKVRHDHDLNPNQFSNDIATLTKDQIANGDGDGDGSTTISPAVKIGRTVAALRRRRRWTVTPDNRTLTTDLDFAPRIHAGGGDGGDAVKSIQNPLQTEVWVLLQHLNHGQVFEVRVCWPASQPTTFDIDVFSPADLVTNADNQLLNRLYGFGQSVTSGESDAEPDSRADHEQGDEDGHDGQDRLPYFVRIRYAPESRARDPTAPRTPVHVDIILDRYLLNVLPQSLVPTVIYILCLVAALALLVFPLVWSLIDRLVEPGHSRAKQHVE